MAEFWGNRGRDFRETCKKLKPLLGKRIERIYAAYTVEDVEGKKQLEAYVEALAAKHLGSGLDIDTAGLVPPPPDKLYGPYELGDVTYAGRPAGIFGLREGELIQHVGIFGRSGAGKTNLGFQMFQQLLGHDKPVLVFDWKRNYRDLLAFPEFAGVEVFTVGRNVAPFHFNPLVPPPNTEPKTWLKQIIEVVASAYCLGNGVLYLLQQSVDAVYEEARVYDGKVERWPTFRDVLNKALERNARGRESAWLASTLRALSSLTFGEMDKLLNAPQEQARQIEHLLKTPTILEMDALSQADKVFLISAMLLYIHHYRMTEGEREQLKHVVMIEEAHHVLSNERRSLIGGQSVMEITFREIREYGESLVVLDQSPSTIAMSALANMYCTICLNLKHQKDVTAMAASMLLDGDEKDLLGSLEVGQAVVKLQGRAPKPFLMEIREFDIQKGRITDADVQMRMQHLLFDPSGIESEVASPGEPGSALDNADSAEVPRSNSSVNHDAINHPPEASSTSKTATTTGLDAHATAFLVDIRDYSDSGVAARYKRLGLSVRQGMKVKESLATDGFIEEREEITTKGRLNRIQLTDQGKQHLAKL